MSSEKEAHEVISHLVGYMLVCSRSMDLLVNGCVRFESKNKKTFYPIPPTIFKNS